ncbi:radical SAM protein [bacterium]|nr:radical SAM protein [bacterium]
MYTINEELSTPCQLDVEITTACNHSCRYCYNFWRHETNRKETMMTFEQADLLIDDIIKNKVFNVVLTGGEPFSNFDVLLYMIKRLTENNILVSCNSNLTLASREKLKKLYDAGLPHILTSIASNSAKINDHIFGVKGAFEKTTTNIRIAVDIGIKISVNTVICSNSVDTIYKTGMFVNELGAKNLFFTRVVPAETCPEVIAQEFIIQPHQNFEILDQALRIKEDTSINIGSLIQYPVCFLKDPLKYVDFVGRGCSAGRKMICLNANGDSHACFHENENHGNVFKIGLKGIWNNLKKWRNGSLIPEICRECSWFRWCEGGCRIFASQLDKPDFLCQGPVGLPEPVEDWEKSIHFVNKKNRFVIKKNIRYREETGFWLFHLIGAWIATVEDQAACFIIDSIKSGNLEFELDSFPGSNKTLADLITKNYIYVEVCNNELTS